MMVDISFPALKDGEVGTFIKLGLRNAQAISLVNAAIVLGLNKGGIGKANITLGAVAPVIIHAVEAEKYLVGRRLDDEIIERAGHNAPTERPEQVIQAVRESMAAATPSHRLPVSKTT